ncbi:MAG: hypothetical protein IJW58_00025 [Clostridia bacterium]|nr:hypothetical protein [Clostridia bacterium]
MSNSSTARDRTVVFVLNILIFILSLCVTLNYCGALGAYHDENNEWKNDTFFGFEMKLTLSEDDIVEMVPLSDYDVDETTLRNTIASNFDENGKLVVPTQNPDVYGEEKMHVAIPTSMLWDVNAQMLKQLIKNFNLNIDTTAYTNALTSENIDKNVDVIVNVLMPVIEDIADLVATETVPVEEAKETLVGEFTENVKASFSELLPKELNESLDGTLKFFAFILLLATGSWIYLMLKIICKLFGRNNAVKLKAPIIFGAIPGFLWSTPKFLSFLAYLAGDAINKLFSEATITLFTETLSVSIFACGWLAFIGMIALVLFAIPYTAARRRLTPRKLR